MKSKKLSAITLTLVLIMLFASCGKKNAPEAEAPAPGSEVVSEAPGAAEAPAADSSANTSDEAVTPETETAKYFSALTGLPVADEAATKRRPVAIMINNIKQALPQYGISKAGIVVEALAEGGITRLLAVFDDVSEVGTIGSIRSARPYYLDFAQSFDAVFIHIGGSPEAYSELKKRDIDSFDLIDGTNSDMYWRDKDRIKNNGYEHSVLTSGERIAKKISAAGLRSERGDSYKKAFNFSSAVEHSGNDATKITANFSSYKTGVYTYDEPTGMYRVSQYGAAHTDALTGQQIAFKNIFVLHINSYAIKGDTAGRLRFDTTGSGKGKYFVNGTAVEITWKRDSKSAPFKFYTSDGAELEVVPGDSYIAVVPLDAKVTVS